VVVVADRAGVTGDDGPSHHGLYDLCSALSIPSVSIYAPSEPAEIAPMLAEALANAPALIRYPKTPSPGPLGPPGEPGRHRVLAAGDRRVVIVGVGKLARAALEAARLVEAASGLAPVVVDPRVIRPAPAELVEEMAEAELLVTAEDGLVLGGAGAYFARLATERAREIGHRPPAVVTLGVPVGYYPQAKPDHILAGLGLDGPGIAASVTAALETYAIAAAQPA
jgi:1-deoxy-D-xylulose-5-phosphate synthase